MTAGEFAKKYGIDYQIVRPATFRTATRQERSWALDYSERELQQAVRAELKMKRDWHLERLEKITEMMEKLDGEAARS